MEIGEETADNLEFMARAKEDAGFPGMSRQRLTVGNLGAVFKSTGCGGADGNNAISRL